MTSVVLPERSAAFLHLVLTYCSLCLGERYLVVDSENGLLLYFRSADAASLMKPPRRVFVLSELASSVTACPQHGPTNRTDDRFEPNTCHSPAEIHPPFCS